MKRFDDDDLGPLVGTWQGFAHLNDFSTQKPEDGAVTVSIQLTGTGELTYTAAP